MRVSLSTWTPERSASLLVIPASLLLSGMLNLADGVPEAGVIAGFLVGITAWVYWLALGVVNRWHVDADEEGVYAWHGPLPSLALSRFVPAEEIRGFLITGGGSENRFGPGFLQHYGIEILHGDHTTTQLVSGCGYGPDVSRVKQALEAYYRVELPSI